MKHRIVLDKPADGEQVIDCMDWQMAGAAVLYWLSDGTSMKGGDFSGTPKSDGLIPLCNIRLIKPIVKDAE